MKNKRLRNYTCQPSACSSGMEWAEVKSFPDFLVSCCGDVVKISHNRRLKGSLDFDGYPSYKLTNDEGRSVHISAHRLVALAFIGDPPKVNSQVAHKNGSRLCCHKSNLRWVTPAENHQDRRDHGTGPVGERNPKAKLTENDVMQIRNIHKDIKNGLSKMKVHELAAAYGLHISTVSNIAAKKSWSHIE